LSVKKFLI